jgi:hypothetical protein
MSKGEATRHVLASLVEVPIAGGRTARVGAWRAASGEPHSVTLSVGWQADGLAWPVTDTVIALPSSAADAVADAVRAAGKVA